MWKESIGHSDPISYLYRRSNLDNNQDEDDHDYEEDNSNKRVTRSATARSVAARMGRSLLSSLTPSSFRSLRSTRSSGTTISHSILSVLQSMAHGIHDGDDAAYVFEQYDEDESEEEDNYDEDNNGSSNNDSDDDDDEEGDDDGNNEEEDGSGISEDDMDSDDESVQDEAGEIIDKDDASDFMRCEDEFELL
jgi:hypothetical protein